MTPYQPPPIFLKLNVDEAFFFAKLQLPEDAKAFEGMVDRLIGAFPRLWDRMDVMPSEVVV